MFEKRNQYAADVLEGTTKKHEGPAWDNSTEYSGLESTEFKKDLDDAKSCLEKMKDLSLKISIQAAIQSDKMPEAALKQVPVLQELFFLEEKVEKIIGNLYTFTTCEQSVDGANNTAKITSSKLRAFLSEFTQVSKSAELFLTLCSDKVIEKYLNHPEISKSRFLVSRMRLLRDQMLPLEQEKLIAALSVDGFSAWGVLYNNISGKLMCEIDMVGGKKNMGVAAAYTQLSSEKEEVRKATWHAIEKAWETQEESCASMLNAISGWRLENYKQRSHKSNVHFLDKAVYQSRITRKTLDVMMGVVSGKKDIGQKVLKLKAKALGKGLLSSWDLGAPAPDFGGEVSELITFDKGVDLVAKSFASINPEMGEFIKMMRDKKWIEGRVLPNKRPGAFCTRFEKSNTPRVYMTYSGQGRDVGTLAHELGHAFHGWLMRDLSLVETHYPMTLAETASICAETVVNEALVASAVTNNEKLKVMWEEMDNVWVLLNNVAARYTFEKELYEKRQEGNLTSDDFKTMIIKHQKYFYGDTVTDLSQMFWASKLHFYITGVSFYNFPYIFGYLFSLGVYAEREKLGDKFFTSYVDLLKDTGKMTCEEVAKKHLNVDLEKPDFWKSSLDIIERKVEVFEKLVNEI